MIGSKASGQRCDGPSTTPIERIWSGAYGFVSRSIHRQRVRMNSPDETGDLLHQAFLQAFVSYGGVTAPTMRDLFRLIHIARNVLVNGERERRRQRQATTAAAHAWEQDHTAAPLCQADLLDLSDALTDLAAHGEMSARAARIVELRYFLGLNMEEVAVAMGLSERSARRAWAFGKAWLRARLSGTDAA